MLSTVKKYNYQIILYLLLITSTLQAQLETAHWFFYNAGIDFTTGTPHNNFDGVQIGSYDGSSISDENGNLLFYTDGGKVINRNHQVMPNGANLGTGFQGDASQSAIIVPFPEDTNRFFIFTTDHTYCTLTFSNGEEVLNCNEEYLVDPAQVNNGLKYFVVNMHLDNGLGDIENEAQLMPLTSEKLTAIRHSNNQDYWVVTHHINKFYAYLVTPLGVNTNPVISTIGTYIDPELYNRIGGAAGHLKFSPDGSKLAVAHRTNLLSSEIPEGLTLHQQYNYPKNAGGYTALYDFNASTGLVSNEIILSDEDLVVPYGLEFSPNSKFLYVEYDLYESVWSWDSAKLVQYNLMSEDIVASAIILYDNFQESGSMTYGSAMGALQLALDGKIYYAQYHPDGNSSLSVIQYPNKPGLNAMFQPYVYQLTDTNHSNHRHTMHLPQFIPSFFKPGLHYEGKLCVLNTISFRVTDDIDSIFWDFGDGNTSTEIYPTHSYNEAGTYIVTATVTYNGLQTVYNKEIIIYALPNSQNAFLEACDNDLDGSAVFLLDGAIPQINSNNNVSISFYVSPEDAEIGVNPLGNEFSTSITPQTVYVRVENENGCASFSELILVTKQGVSMKIEDQVICPEMGSVTIEIPENYTSYFWQGLQGQDLNQPLDMPYITITKSGQYSLTVVNENSCEYTETFTVNYSETPIIKEINFHQNVVEIIAQGQEPLEYSLNGVLWQSSNKFYDLNKATYALYIRDAFGCTFQMEKFSIFNIPNFISPNGDGYNDIWEIRGLANYDKAKVQIFDRYGKTLVHRNVSGEDIVWNGTYLGNPVPSGTYWYIITVNNRNYIGSITVKNQISNP